jgi:hypothetical protein
MANSVKGEVSVEADGETKGITFEPHSDRLPENLRGRYTLLFSINALCELEEKMGGAVTDIASLAMGGKRFTTIRNVFWAGLRDYHPDITLQDAGRIITAIGLEKADEAIGLAFGLTFPETKAAAPPLPLTVAKPARNGRARTGLAS